MIIRGDNKKRTNSRGAYFYFYKQQLYTMNMIKDNLMLNVKRVNNFLNSYILSYRDHDALAATFVQVNYLKKCWTRFSVPT